MRFSYINAINMQALELIYRDPIGNSQRICAIACYDYAVAVSFFSKLKNELVHHCDLQSKDAARSAIFDYIERFYSRQREH